MEKKYAIGADIGGTNTALALVCDDGVVAMRSALPTAGGTPRASLPDFYPNRTFVFGSALDKQKNLR